MFPLCSGRKSCREAKRGGFSLLWPNTGHLDCHTDALLFVAVARGLRLRKGQWRQHGPRHSWKDAQGRHSSAGLLVPGSRDLSPAGVCPNPSSLPLFGLVTFNELLTHPCPIFHVQRIG